MIRSTLLALAVLTVYILSFGVLSCSADAQVNTAQKSQTTQRANSLIEYLQVQRSEAEAFHVDTRGEELAVFHTPTEEEVQQVLFEGIVAPSTIGGWELFPDSLLYHSYMAGEKEPRFASQWLWEKDRGRIWEAAVGGRWGVFRKGTSGPNGEGFQFDVEGAALVRIDPESEDDLEAADFRAGFLGTWKRGQYRWKFGYYHLSSHVGDEFLENNPTFMRRNYVRDALLLGLVYDITPEIAIYGEYAYAANSNGGAEPGEFQFGFEYSALEPIWLRGSPFFAINGHLREEFNYGGSVNVLAGWQWIGPNSGHSFRFGFQHYNGPSMQYSFVDQHEALSGLGIWFDF